MTSSSMHFILNGMELSAISSVPVVISNIPDSMYLYLKYPIYFNELHNIEKMIMYIPIDIVVLTDSVITDSFPAEKETGKLLQFVKCFL